MLEKPLKELAPSGVGDNLVSDGDDGADADYLNGVVHAVIPFVLGYFSFVVGFLYFVCAFLLYCSVYRKHSQGFFGTTAIVALFVILMSIPN